MTTLHEENDWSSQFEITQEDLDQIAQRLERGGAPQQLKEIASHIIRERMEQGYDFGPLGDNKLKFDNENRQAENILLQEGEPILRHLVDALRLDFRFTSLEGKWFIADKLPRIGRSTLQKVYQILSKNPSAAENELLTVVKENDLTDKTLLRMALHAALQSSPGRFQNIGTAAHPQWKARLPEIEQTEVTHYAYDPQTYEILCRPGQKLSEKKAERLQALHLYVHVVTFAE